MFLINRLKFFNIHLIKNKDFQSDKTNVNNVLSLASIRKFFGMENKLSSTVEEINDIEEMNGNSSEKPIETKTENIIKLSKRVLRTINRRKKERECQIHPEPGCYMTKNEIRHAREKALKEMRDMEEIIFNETEYYFENGLRKVRPYHFKFISSAKGRWFGRTISDIHTKEFRGGSVERCKVLIEKGKLKILGKVTTHDYVLQDGDIMTNQIHRHELPVTAKPLCIVAETEEILAVDKPSSIPVHPCGRYRHNSLVFILAREHGYRNLRVMHRLDRLTSGIILLGKTEGITSKIMECIRNREVKKEYLAKVEGVFPRETIECNQPLDVLNHSLGIHCVSPTGRESSTVFNLVATDGKTSIIRCHPKTGRTHQIRIHLQYLGYPITNDPLYNGNVWGPDKGKNGIYHKSKEQLIEDLTTLHEASLYYDAETIKMRTETSSFDEPPPKRTKADDIVSGVDATNAGINTPEDASDGIQSPYGDPDCDNCSVKFIDPKPEQLCIYLHALCYEAKDWKFSTEMPAWAHYDNPVELHEHSSSS